MNASKELLRVEICNGKYTVVQDADGALHALRYGDEWRDCVGDNLILGLAQEVESLREKIAQAANEYIATQPTTLERLRKVALALGWQPPAQDDTVAELEKQRDELQRQNTAMRQVLERFIKKVESGLARSKHTYSEAKSALEVK